MSFFDFVLMVLAAYAAVYVLYDAYKYWRNKVYIDKCYGRDKKRKIK